mmetsp:Transcript_6451/g.22651  ORF Transcript_6451/g.22651 Transcript_6451/m.22651 type:complete len:227 (+) Transcript_6451:311-991(+)
MAPASVSASECEPHAAMRATRMRLSARRQSSVGTCTSTPSSSTPTTSAAPHARRRPLLSRSRVWSSPHAISTTRAPPQKRCATRRGSRTSARPTASYASLCPSWPRALPPHVNTAPPTASATEWRRAAATCAMRTAAPIERRGPSENRGGEPRRCTAKCTARGVHVEVHAAPRPRRPWAPWPKAWTRPAPSTTREWTDPVASARPRRSAFRRASTHAAACDAAMFV